MIETLYKLGKHSYLTKEEALIEDPRSQKVIEVLFKNNDDGIHYVSSQLKDLKQPIEQYGFCERNGTALNHSPSARIGKNDKTAKKIQSRFIEWFHIHPGHLSDQIAIELTKNKVAEDIISQMKNIGQYDSYLVFVSIQDNGQKKYPLDISEFNNAVLQPFDDLFSKAKTGICTVCNKEKKVTGDFKPYKFTTFDKLGNISDMKEKNKSRMFPVCKECALTILKGRKFVDNYCDYKICGMRVKIIPKPLTTDYEEIISFMKKATTTISSRQEKINRLHRKKAENTRSNLDKIKRLTDYEYTILDELEEKEDSFTVDMLFYELDHAKMNILANIKNIAPSRIQQILVAKQQIDQTDILGRGYYLNDLLNILGKRANDTSDREQARKLFLTYLQAVLLTNKIDESNFLHHIMRQIRDDLYDKKKTSKLNRFQDHFHWTMRSALASKVFLEKLSVL